MTDSVNDLLRAEVSQTEQEVRSFRAKQAWKRRKEQAKETDLTPAVAYIRASLLKRNAQKERIEAYAQKNGLKIIRFYEDVITSRMQQCSRMLEDAANGDFAVILCLDLSRFRRFDTFRYNQEMKSLHEAGVKLHTVVEGEIEWTAHNELLVQSGSSRA